MKEILMRYCLAKPAAAQDFQPAWDAVRFFIGGKMFALFGCSKTGEPIVTLKCDPADAVVLRARYPDIVPGYYMNKTHWNSVFLDGGVPQSVFFHMIDQSYILVVQTLSKRERERIPESPGLLLKGKPGGE